jgi:predicted GIY-YIG superfamily endonuclease
MESISLHFSRPLLKGRPARHYIGWAHNVKARVYHHRKGQGAAITRAARQRSIGLKVARVWYGQDRAFERQLKNQKNATRLCPICNPDYAGKYGLEAPDNSSSF